MNMNDSKIIALVVDDDSRNLRGLERLLKTRGIIVFGTTSPKAALKVLQSNPKHFDVLLTDFDMPEMTGGELIEKMRAVLGPDAPRCICITGSIDPNVPGDVEVMLKPPDFDALIRSITKGGTR